MAGLEVGAEIEAYCKSCKINTTCIVVTKDDTKIYLVSCRQCETEQAYHPPKGGKAKKKTTRKTSKRRTAARKGKSSGSRRDNKEWVQFTKDRKLNEPRLYSLQETYQPQELIEHPRFGIGFVRELMLDNKMIAVFKSGPLTMIYNRPDLDPLSPASLETEEINGPEPPSAEEPVASKKDPQSAPPVAKKTAAKKEVTDKPATKKPAAKKTTTKKSAAASKSAKKSNPAKK